MDERKKGINTIATANTARRAAKASATAFFLFRCQVAASSVPQPHPVAGTVRARSVDTATAAF